MVAVCGSVGTESTGLLAVRLAEWPGITAFDLLDLLRKSGLGGKAIAECGNEIDPKVKATPSVPVCFFENAEDLEPPDHVLHGQPASSEVAIAHSLIVGERVMLARLLRRPGQGMMVVNALIPGVSEEFGVRVDGRLRLLRESKIMRRPSAGGNAEDLHGDRMH